MNNKKEMAIIKSNGYDVVFGNGVFNAITAFLKKKSYASYFIICDENTLQHCMPVLITSCPLLAEAAVIEIESGEESKSFEFCAHILQTLVEEKAGKDSLVINLGGGVVSDLGGFTASIYKRGIDFINIPTSLLAMADASVGGKTGIDFAGIKNSVGTFNQPVSVFVSTAFLNTLPQAHYKNGLAEIYKIALVNDKALWKHLASGSYVANAGELIEKSIALKNKIVLKDPFDKGMRKVLNFGHTIGHALESLLLNTGNSLLHGEAVVVGMIVESHIAYQKKMITKPVLTEITTQLTAAFGLKEVSHVGLAEIINVIKHDKKSLAGKMLFALVNNIGSCTWDIAVTTGQVEKALAYYNALK